MESNSQEEPQDNEVAKLDVVLHYCSFEECRGAPVEAKIEEDDSECSICYESFDSLKVAVFDPCQHMFCSKCVARSKNEYCHVCRQPMEEIYYFNKPIASKLDEIDYKKHVDCAYNPIINEYLKDLNDEWLALATFMLEATLDELSVTMKGTRALKLKKYQDEGKIQYKGTNAVVLKSTEEETQVVICAIWENFSMRLILTKQNNFNFDVDNEYADHVATVLNKQLAICWRVIPHIIDRRSYDHLYVRKFENITCNLLLCGFEDIGIYMLHFDNMRMELNDLKKINFDETEYKKIRDTFPPLRLTKLRSKNYVYEFWCCRETDETKEKGYKKFSLEELYDLAEKNGHTGLPRK